MMIFQNDNSKYEKKRFYAYETKCWVIIKLYLSYIKLSTESLKYLKTKTKNWLLTDCPLLADHHTTIALINITNKTQQRALGNYEEA